MRMFKQMREGFARMMYGRNGIDQLNLALAWCGLVLMVPASFLTRHHHLVGSLLAGISDLILLVLFFRIFSRNLYQRQEENRRWLRQRDQIRIRWQGARRRHADKEHKYFTCRNCQTICRVPVGQGEIEITCPNCGAKIRGKT